MVMKMDFVRLGQDMKLLDCGGAMGEKRKPQTPRKERKGEEMEGGGKVSLHYNMGRGMSNQEQGPPSV